MKEFELKNIDSIQIFKISVVLFAVCLFMMGLIVSSYGLVAEGFGKFMQGLLGTFALSMIMAPIYALIAAVCAGLYNTVSKLVGGLKVTLNVEEK